MFKFFRRRTVSAPFVHPRNPRSPAVAATTPVTAGDELSGLGGNFWEDLAATAKKVQTFGKEVTKIGKVTTEIRKLVKPSSGVTVVPPGQPVTVTKPSTANEQTPPNGIPLGSSIPEPQIARMTATDAPAEDKVKPYLIPAAIGVAAVGLFYAFVSRKNR